MNINMAVYVAFFYIMLVVSFATACDRCVHQSRAAYFADDSPLSSGACGYGSLALDFNGGFLAGGVSSLYNNGAGCGACFQIRCRNTTLCSETGTTVIMSDLNTNPDVDLVLSNRAFKAMSNSEKYQDLLKLGISDVEYMRIPCDYKGKNLVIRVEESSHPNYLAIKILYQGGQTQIVSIDVSQVGEPKWVSMKRNYGVIWDTSIVPSGPLQFKFVVISGYDNKEIRAENVLPEDWKPGVDYDTNVQITDIAQESCTPCFGDTHWI